MAIQSFAETPPGLYACKAREPSRPFRRWQNFLTIKTSESEVKRNAPSSILSLWQHSFSVDFPHLIHNGQFHAHMRTLAWNRLDRCPTIQQPCSLANTLQSESLFFD
jgi:hypothetical protein